MATSKVEIVLADAINVDVTNDALTVELSDGRTISVPLAWYPRLLHATPAERKDWRLIGKGKGVHWNALDEDISVENLLAGRPSTESQASLRRWLAGRVRRP
jgi:DNA-binding CsgD family transcriptional regulator